MALAVVLIHTVPLPSLAVEDAARGAGREPAAGGDPDDLLLPPELFEVEEIVVTARRREERLEDTPVSVTALDEKTLREAEITKVDQIEQLVPNLVFTRSFTGTVGEIKIRGVGTSAIDGIFDPGVGVYLDGVYLARTGSQVFELVDVEQIEVLRGPQGTLFGKNSIGGAITVTTVKPQDELQGFALLRPGNFDSLDTRAMLNVPLLDDRILSRLSFGSSQTSGYTTNTLLDLDYNDPSVLSFLGQLRFLPADPVVLDLSGIYTKEHGHGLGPQCRVVTETPGLIRNPPAGYFDACQQSQPFSFQANVRGLQSLQTSGVWGTANWAIGDVGVFRDLAVKAIGSWRRQETANRIDLDGTRFQVASLAANGGGPGQGEPFVVDMEQAEVQLNGRFLDDTITFVSGAFGLWEDQTAVVDLNLAGAQLPSQIQDFDNWTWALFSQATWEPLEWLSLTGGVRYTEEKKGAATGTLEPTVTNSAIFNKWTPMASLAFALPTDRIEGTQIDHLLGYFTYSEGFKGGGFNLAAGSSPTSLDPFAPETLNSYEIGFKTIALDQRLSFNAAFFLGDYDDIQVTTLRVMGDGFERVTENAAKATTKGFELELLALPLDGVQVTGSVGLTDAKYDDFEGANAITDAPIDRDGQTFNGVPKLQTHLALQYSLPISLGGARWIDGWLTPRLEWYYQSSVHWDFPELVAGVQHGYNLLHFRLGYAFGDGRAEVAMWARNMTGEEYFDAVLSIANVAGTLYRTFAPPATFGAELSYRF